MWLHGLIVGATARAILCFTQKQHHLRLLPASSGFHKHLRSSHHTGFINTSSVSTLSYSGFLSEKYFINPDTHPKLGRWEYKNPWSGSSSFMGSTPTYSSSSLGSTINENVLVNLRSYVVTKMRVDNNLKWAKLTASINNHNTSMHTTILCIATKHKQGK